MHKMLLLGGCGILGSEALLVIDIKGYDYLAPTSTNLDTADKEPLFKYV